MQRLLGLPEASFASANQAEAAPTLTQGCVASEWALAGEILKRIKAPVLPARAFPITGFGATADGKTDCTEAIKMAVDTCAKSGGGAVVSQGEFLTGPIRLKSNVELHLEAGATLKFKTDPGAYLPAVLTRFEGMDCYNYAPLIYACSQENIAVTGEGLLDGQAGDQIWWPWKGKNPSGQKVRRTKRRHASGS